MVARPATRAARPAAKRKGCKAGDAGGAPGSEVKRSQGRQQGLTPGAPTIMIDPIAMAVDGGNANGEAHVAHAVAEEGPEVERSTDPDMLRQIQNYAVDEIPTRSVAAAMALHGGIALHIDLTRSTKALRSHGIGGLSRDHKRIAKRSQSKPSGADLATQSIETPGIGERHDPAVVP